MENRLDTRANSGMREPSTQVPLLQQNQELMFVVKSLQETFNLSKPLLLTCSGHLGDYCKFICNFEHSTESVRSHVEIILFDPILYWRGKT